MSEGDTPGTGWWRSGTLWTVVVAAACALCCVVPPALLLGGALTVAGTGVAAVTGAIAIGAPWLAGIGILLPAAGLVAFAAVRRARRASADAACSTP
jgi:hypothetical protein